MDMFRKPIWQLWLRQDSDGTALLLEPNDNPLAQMYQEGIYSAGLPSIVVTVDDIQTEYERLKNKGGIQKGAQ